MTLSVRHHQLIRFVCALCIVSGLTYMGLRSQVRADITAEHLSQLTPSTLELIEGIDETRPVAVHAFISRNVPRQYVTTRMRLLNVLREMQARAGAGLTVRIVEPEAFSVDAEEAMENFRIEPQTVQSRGEGGSQSMQVFLGVALVSGPREEVIPFLDRGQSAEYELARALRVVKQERKKVLGIVQTDASIMGNFDLQSRRQKPAWAVVAELRKQYDVRSINPEAPIGDDVDVIFVPQLASLEQSGLDSLFTYIDAGRPALLTADPLPVFDVRLSPSEPKLPPPGQQGGPFGGGGPPPGAKGDVVGFLKAVGLEWSPELILYDTHNPFPMFEGAPPHIAFVTERPDGTNPFDGRDTVTDGLNTIVAIFAGELKPVGGFRDAFVPLLETGRTAGYSRYEQMVQRHPLFGTSLGVPRPGTPVDGKVHVLAARIRRDGAGPAKASPDEGAESGGNDEHDTPKAEGEEARRNVVVVADLDMFGDMFFQLEARGTDVDDDGLVDYRLDNVPFLLNTIDDLAGDDRFIAIRKRRAGFRRLTEVDALTREARREKLDSSEGTKKTAEVELEEAQAALSAAVAVVQERKDLDETTKAIMVKSAEEAENRRLETKQKKINLEQEKKLYRVDLEYRRAVDKVQGSIRLAAVLLPPIPAVLLGLALFSRKRRRERETIPQARMTGGRARTKPKNESKGGAA